MTKEDYMKLSKERLAELLVEKDLKSVIPAIEHYSSPCFAGGQCINPFHDCINCPYQFGNKPWISTTTLNSIQTESK
jgi:hypothetical protein